MGEGPNDKGSSRYHLIQACEASLQRLGTDYIDVYFMHGFDALTPVEETVRALDALVQSGKVRYVGCSNFSGWQVMKSLPVADRPGGADNGPLCSVVVGSVGGRNARLATKVTASTCCTYEDILRV